MYFGKMCTEEALQSDAAGPKYRLHVSKLYLWYINVQLSNRRTEKERQTVELPDLDVVYSGKP